MKKIILLSFIALTLFACQKETTESPPENRILDSHNAKLAVAINGAFEIVPVNVKIIRYDYDMGGSLIISDSMTYRISSTVATPWRHVQKTPYAYKGVLQVNVMSDSVGTRVYSRSVILTDPGGSVVNLDTTQQAISGYAGMRHISDAVPKLIQ